MSDVKKPDWPQTPDGTIDWETVFDHPETGIIPALSHANNKQTLHKITVAIIQQLFTRKNYEVQVERFLKELDGILGDTAGSEDLPKMQGAIIDLLRRIKDGRIEKAAAYVAEKKKEAAEGVRNKRKKKREKRREGEAQKNSTATLALGAVAVIIAIITVLSLFFILGSEEETPSDAQDDQPDAAVQEAPTEPDPPARPQLELSDDGYPLGRLGLEEVAELGSNVMVLRQFSWSGQVEGGSPQGTILIPVLIIEESGLASRICDYAPNLIDAINLALGRSVASGGEASPDTLRGAGQAAMQMANKRLGKSWINDLYLLHNVDRKLQAAAKKCQILDQ